MDARSGSGGANAHAAAGATRGFDLAALKAAPRGWSLRQTLAPGVQRVGPLGEIPALLREFGLRPADVLRRAGLAKDALEDREGRIPFADTGRLLALCAEATRREDFGLLLASRWRLEHLGLVGELMVTSQTVAQALESFASVHWINASGGAVFLRRHDDVTTLGYAIYEPGMEVGVHQAYDMVLGVGVQMMRELTGARQWVPKRVQLSRPRPASVEPYRRFFRGPVQFDAQSSLLQYPSRFNSIPLKSRDETRRRSLAALLAGRREEIVPKLHRMVRIALLFGLSADDLADAMFMSHRTLNRRLHAFGANYRDVLQSVRFEASRQLLRDTSLPVADIASALGYAETSPFVRAFRRWSATTPQSWREAAVAERPHDEASGA